ncbi:hypothetical protein B484DRAFT_281839 [Ochromonadaceae sp. CCMP2298]|nr:hypothetical protein B484DRAFT_281839 [Ochromonadaceae sp. CCMP2298]
MREASKNIMHDQQDDKDNRAYAEAKLSFLEQDEAQAKDYSGGGRSQSKPAWAMTETAAEVQQDDMKSSEEDELLEFAQGLDFDRYMGDMEVQSVMERLRKRITELERDVVHEDMRHADAETRSKIREKLAKLGLSEASLNSGPQQSAESEAIYAARALLQEEEDLQAVHSAKSAAALLKAAKEKIALVAAAMHNAAPPSQPRILNEPVVIMHEPSEGARLNGKNEISNLPYMHRNPAI